MSKIRGTVRDDSEIKFSSLNGYPITIGVLGGDILKFTVQDGKFTYMSFLVELEKENTSRLIKMLQENNNG